MKVSVIMSVYNPNPFSQLEEAVCSIIKQTFKDWELVLYNDGSDTEKTERIKRLAERDSRIRYLEGDKNRGIAYGLNECIRNAEGEFLARMDGDDIAFPERLEKQVKFLESHREYGYVGTEAFLFDEKGIWGVRKMKEKPEQEDFLCFSPYIHPSVMFRKRVFQMHGLYCVSEDILRCEDYELFTRLYISGCYGYNLQEKLICYREDGESYKKRKFRRRMEEVKLRKKSFRQLGLTGTKAWIFRYRPLAAAVVPSVVYRQIRRKKYFYKERDSYGGYPYTDSSEMCGGRTGAIAC